MAKIKLDDFSSEIKLKKTKYDYIILDATTKIKVINRHQGEKIILLDFNHCTYMIDDTYNKQKVCVFSQHEDGETADPIKSM
jgi:hypothetical protein